MQDPIWQSAIPGRRERDDRQNPQDRNAASAHTSSRLVFSLKNIKGNTRVKLDCFCYSLLTFGKTLYELNDFILTPKLYNFSNSGCQTTITIVKQTQLKMWKNHFSQIIHTLRKVLNFLFQRIQNLHIQIWVWIK